LQWRVIRRWGAEAKTFVVVGDDDQSLYSFTGARPDDFLISLPAKQQRTLDHSYRLPRAVHATAERWIHKLDGRREPKTYSARDADGLVTERPELSMSNVAELARELANETRPTMCLAACGYMLKPLLAELKAQGVPFCNRFKPDRGDWNPVTVTGSRLLAFLRVARRLREDVIAPASDWWPWIEMMKDLQRGARKGFKLKLDSSAPITESDLHRWLTAGVVAALETDDLVWLSQHTTARFTKAVEYPLTVLAARGEDALTGDIKLTVGTMHSVKGGEADVVYLFPDLSHASVRDIHTRGQDARDAIARQVYVGMTRAREELHLCGPSVKTHFAWP